jgi:outer membrane protein OmpA-like peptidoglycan-associated protein
MKKKWMVLLVIAMFCAAGCSSMSRRAKCASVGAAAGAVIGTTAGLIIGHNNDHQSGGGIIGGVAGAVLGGVTGYLVCQNDPEPAPPVKVVEVVEVVEVAEVVEVTPEKIILNAVQFDFNKAVIKEEYSPVLDAGAMALQDAGDRQIMITGYTCSMGPEAYNQTLSESRAESVKAYLVDKGISADRLMTSGGGESNPIGDNENKDGREMNRRAELQVME